MSEVEAMATIATYKETLREVGITNTEDFKKQLLDVSKNYELEVKNKIKDLKKQL